MVLFGWVVPNWVYPVAVFGSAIVVFSIQYCIKYLANRPDTAAPASEHHELQFWEMIGAGAARARARAHAHAAAEEERAVGGGARERGGEEEGDIGLARPLPLAG
ncbi:hypothetical protein OCU04_011338 [Sclerotinia nivalis]|uniref:Uncharacterized protein n=1 Tax=Sclerotinia nivalis TaxID=352851 RepID=A0A9X0AB88_9HELO|nr:hypothetical protein OCU04_011338 [Sclerotinia nivalis]